ncbi:uncharacterized protein [Phyllobates terribilis]|uniref:uncharacterized protein isoform X2 n=1 Tax=Phyllobates terribilis TaxID=111132 RepID=UPI003CCB4193
MNMDRDKMAEKILHLTLEILFRLTGEDYTVEKKTSSERCQDFLSEGWERTLSPIMELPPHPLMHEDINDQKILDLTYKMIELLTGEVPIRCQDITVYFSMEEWEYLEGHKDLYKDVMMEVPQPLTSPDLSSKRTTPERCPCPLLPQDCKQEDPNVPQDHQGEDLTHINTTETYVRGDERCKEEIPTDNSPDDCTRRSEGQLTSSIFKSDELEIPQDTIEGNAITPDIPSSLHSKDVSSDPLIQAAVTSKVYDCPFSTWDVMGRLTPGPTEKGRNVGCPGVYVSMGRLVAAIPSASLDPYGDFRITGIGRCRECDDYRSNAGCAKQKAAQDLLNQGTLQLQEGRSCFTRCNNVKRGKSRSLISVIAATQGDSAFISSLETREGNVVQSTVDILKVLEE